jgi:hypothetical protein
MRTQYLVYGMPFVPFLRLPHLRVCSRRAAAKVGAEPAALALATAPAVFEQLDRAGPLPYASDVTTSGRPDSGTDVRVVFHLLLHPLPQFLPARGRELMSKYVISQLRHADSLVWIRPWFLDAHYCMVGKTVKDVAGELFCLCFHGSVLCNRVFAIPARENDEDDCYNLENISFKRLSEGLADAAGEAEFGKRR